MLSDLPSADPAPTADPAADLDDVEPVVLGDLPEMSYREASFHQAVAGQRAAEAAAHAPTEAARAVVEGAAGGYTTPGLTLPPPCAGSVLCIELLYDRMRAAEIELTHFDSTALVVYCFRHPSAAWRALVQDGSPGATQEVLRQARELCGRVPIPDMAKLRRWCLDQVAALRGEGTEKKTGSTPPGAP